MTDEEHMLEALGDAIEAVGKVIAIVTDPWPKERKIAFAKQYAHDLKMAAAEVEESLKLEAKA